LIRNKYLFYMLLLLISSFLIAMLIPVEYLPVNTRHDKYHHGIMFFVITLITYGCLRVSIFGVACLMSVLAIVSESSQFLISYRSANWLDLQADFLGIGIAISLLLLLCLGKKIKNKP
jgi:VanZ family protein